MPVLYVRSGASMNSSSCAKPTTSPMRARASRRVSPATSIALPVIVAVQFLVTVGPCLILSAVNVKFRDVTNIVEIALLPLFYATPVIFSPPAHRFHWVFQLNPLTHLIAAYRDALFYGRWPETGPLVVLALIGLALAAIGYRVFDRLSYRFPEEL